MDPPGTGKSVTAMAFATTVDRSKWMVTWVHVREGSKLSWCVRLVGDTRKTIVTEMKMLPEVLHAGETERRFHLVIVAGWTPGIKEKLNTKCEDGSPRKRRRSNGGSCLCARRVGVGNRKLTMTF